MPYYEVVYEDDSVSVANYANDEEATSAILEQHDRAKTGRKNGPQEANATRIAKVFVYPTHPGDYGTEGGLSTDEVKTSINAMLEGVEAVDVQQLATRVSALNHPMVANAAVHESKYKMESERELELAL